MLARNTFIPATAELIAATAALLLAQQPGLAQEPIQVTTRLVEVSVVVRDGHGPVANLSRDDFKIFDKGKERPIAVFHAISSPRSNGSQSANDNSAQLEPLPKGVFTNRRDVPEANAVSATVVLMDALNTDPVDQQGVRKQLLKYIATMHADATRPVAIYQLGTDIRVLQDFTDDPAILQKAAAKFQGASTALYRASNEAAPYTDDALMANDPTIAALREAFNEMNDFHTVDRVETTAKALEQIAAHLASIPGRKTLIWMSGSFPSFLMNAEGHSFTAANRENRTFDEEIKRAVKAMSTANVAIYAVDARGLAGVPASGGVATQLAPGGSRRSRNGAFGTATNGQIGALTVDTPDGLETMKQLAEGTGGRAFVNTNDLQGAVDKAMEDADVSYMLGFYAPDPSDESFHELKVKVDRPGVEARYRSGYLSMSSKPPGKNDRTAILRNAATSSLDATAIRLAAALDPAQSGSIQVTLKIDMNDFVLENKNGKWSGGADVDFVSLAADGKVLGLASKTISFDLTNDAYLARKKDGVILQQSVAANQKLARLRVVVLDHETGAVGSLSMRP